MFRQITTLFKISGHENYGGSTCRCACPELSRGKCFVRKAASYPVLHIKIKFHNQQEQH